MSQYRVRKMLTDETSQFMSNGTDQVIKMGRENGKKRKEEKYSYAYTLFCVCGNLGETKENTALLTRIIKGAIFFQISRSHLQIEGILTKSC
jgi:hypothetical protein